MEKINNTDVILHAFDWPYSLIEQQAEKIAHMGYRSVLISPAMKSLCLPQGTPWWQRYQPQDYRVIDNQLGNLSSLRSMITTLDANGIHVYVDVVFNHMANESDIRHDLQYPNDEILAQYQQESEYYQAQKLFGDLATPLFSEDDFVEAFSISDWGDKWQVQHGRLVGDEHDPGLPTLMDNSHVVAQQRAYLIALKQLGVKGFRIDAAKHMTLEHLTQVWSADICEGVHIFAEIITDGGATKQEYQDFLEPYLASTPMGAYDFPLFQTLLEAFQPTGTLTSLVNPYSLGQALAESRAVTFAITHDIPNNAVFTGLVMEEEWEALAYIYLFGRDGGVPLVYSDLNTSGFENQQGIPRWQEEWQSPSMRAMIQFHNQMHGSPMTVLQSGDEKLAFSRAGKGIVLLNKSSKVQRFELSVEGEWRDVLLKSRCEREETLVVEVSPRSGAMLVPVVS
ncbi:alpha-amylase family protein [Vibrio scophthalmi]|uniref:alpha-amylase family protein n=1 Tax=Vibrio scophthalmi TaxID=45658 RepID=UPI003872EEBE